MEHVFRKVTFSFAPACGFSPDEDEQNELIESARVREGVFYGTTEDYDEKNGLKILKFVVEEEETGKIHYVDPLLVKFKK